MINIAKGKLYVMVGTQIASAALGLGGISAVVAAKQHTQDVCFTQSCEVKVKGEDLEAQIDKAFPVDNVNAEVKTATISPMVISSIPRSSKMYMDSAMVRSMIVDEYNKYITDTKSYLNDSYPASAFSAALSNGDKALMAFTTQRYFDIQNRTKNFASTFCDLNSKITPEDNRSFCHSQFDIKNVRESLNI